MTGGAPAPGGLPAAWSHVAPSYARYIVPGFLPAAQALCDALPLRPGQRVLDIACGPGTVALVAARRGAEVTGVDYAPGMVDLARERGRAFPGCRFLLGDATALPVPSASYDLALSSFGLIFAADPVAAVREAARTLRPGGRLGLLAWVKADTTEAYYEVVYRHLPRPRGGHDPYDWGIEAQARAWLAAAFEEVAFRPVDVPFAAESPAVAWDVLKRSTGRVAAQYWLLDPERQAAMDADLEAWFRQWQTAEGTVAWPRHAWIITGRRTG